MLEPAPSSLPSSADPTAASVRGVARPAPAASGAAIPPPSAAPPGSLGGYRVVRRLGGGSTAAVLLARGGGSSVALRCYREGVPDSRIDAEVESLGRVRSRHLATLLDLATGVDGRPVPVLDAVIGPTLEELLRRRSGSLDPGEAVTVLAPLAELVHELHEVGVTVGRWGAAGVRIGADGAPVLTALSGLLAAPPLPERFRRREPGILADLVGLRGLAERVVAGVRPERRDALLAAIEGVDDALSLEQALFDAARPAPVVLALSSAAPHPDPEVVASDGRYRQAPSGSEIADGHERHEPGLRGTVLRILDDLGLPPAVVSALRPTPDRDLPGAPSRLRAPRPVRADWLDKPQKPRRAGRSAEPGAAPRPRRSIVLLGAAGLVALAASIAVVVLDVDAQGSARSGAQSVPADERPGESDAAIPPVEESPEPEDPAAPAAVDTGAEPASEEWLALVAELARRWANCREQGRSGEGSDSCASTVVQEGSAASESLLDSRVTAADDLLAQPPADVVVADRLGSAALIDLIHDDGTRTASLLVVRSEAGWRVRSVLD
ncbi:hypothetical protein OVN20_09465 [Microcella daejeonensis]|uniref:hypothetical protein n=1 Tax=Microcella daejeonensis TaxID=2994971 RepID=UPI00226FBB63|nr:hypothetical protein [Microcella daejeonensis]WAB83297.1 hypothetical protein OVN20_09465 [Microcella daejeonensis]